MYVSIRCASCPSACNCILLTHTFRYNFSPTIFFLCFTPSFYKVAGLGRGPQHVAESVGLGVGLDLDHQHGTDGGLGPVRQLKVKEGIVQVPVPVPVPVLQRDEMVLWMLLVLPVVVVRRENGRGRGPSHRLG